MAQEQILLFLPAILSALLPDSGGQVQSYDTSRAGHATYYLAADGTGNCMLDALPEPQLVGALNNFDYNSPVINGAIYPTATLCGAYARVTGDKGSVIIKIVDRCPDALCAQGHIDLSLEAFTAIDDPDKGYIPITWELVSAPVSGPIQFRYKDGSSQWWTAIQVRNHRNPVARLEVLQGDSWQDLPRKQYNYFVAETGFGEGYHSIRVTDIFGHQLIETSTVFLDSYQPDTVDWQGKGQFPKP